MTSPLLCSLGHVASTAILRSRGITERQIRSAIENDRVLRVRRGTYACAHLDSDAVRAISMGGVLSCISVLKLDGVWAGHSRDLHVQLPPSASASRQKGIRLHREHPQFDNEDAWKVSRMQALWRAIRCVDEEHALAALESAIHLDYLPIADVRAIIRHAPRRLEKYTRHLVLNSGSGNETVVRIRLIFAGHTAVPQTFVPGMGHGDVLVDDCVIVEVDGRRWHGPDRFATDHDRDLAAEGFGRHVIRVRASHIYETWPFTLAVIERAVSDARVDYDRRFPQGRVWLGDSTRVIA